MSARTLLHRAARTVPYAAKPDGARRGLATAALPFSRITTLPNGLTVATDASPAAQTATVGTWIDAGSRHDTDEASGTANLLAQLALKGTTSRSAASLESDIEKLGARLGSYTTREHTAYVAQSLGKDVSKTVEILSDLLQNPALDASALEAQRSAVVKEQDHAKPIKELVFEYLHAIAFQKQGLGRTIVGSDETVPTLKKGDLELFKSKHYTSDHTVLVGTGAVNHDELVRLAEQHFQLPGSSKPLVLEEKPSTHFVGSDVRHRDDAVPQASFAIAVEGASYNSADYVPLQVLQAILGNWDQSLGARDLLSSRLTKTVSDNGLANSYQHFNLSYSDTGLWGVYVESDHIMGLDDTTHFILKEWQRQSIAPSSVDVERAKIQLKASIAYSLDSHAAVAEDIGRQVAATGKRQPLAQLQAKIDEVTPADIKRVALKYLWDRDIAIAAHGPVEGLFTYDRIRADMSSMIY